MTQEAFVDLCLRDLAEEIMRPLLEEALDATLDDYPKWVRDMMTPEEREYILTGKPEGELKGPTR